MERGRGRGRGQERILGGMLRTDGEVVPGVWGMGVRVRRLPGTCASTISFVSKVQPLITLEPLSKYTPEPHSRTRLPGTCTSTISFVTSRGMV